MDSTQFDQFARSVSRVASRRGVIQGLLAGLAAVLAGGREAGAQRESRLIGEPCTRTQQCSQAGDLGEVYCDDNGFDHDGPLNCCKYSGLCLQDEHCCGGLGCVEGRCMRRLGAGDECFASSQCRAADTSLICADNGVAYDGPLNCCAPEGGRCFADEGCCGYAWCGGGFCQGAAGNPYTPQEENPYNVGLGQGDSCVNSGQCYSPYTPLFCDENLNDDSGYRCCAMHGGTCGSAYGCCGYLNCLGGYCQ